MWSYVKIKVLICVTICETRYDHITLPSLQTIATLTKICNTYRNLRLENIFILWRKSYRFNFIKFYRFQGMTIWEVRVWANIVISTENNCLYQLSDDSSRLAVDSSI